MNHYGAMAMRHWKTHLPERYAQIEDPETFFSQMGERASDQIRELQVQLAGPDTRGEDYMAKVGRLTNARMRAEEIVLSEEVLAAPPESGMEEPTDADWDWVIWTEEDRERDRRAAAQEKEFEETGWRTVVISPEELADREAEKRENAEIYRQILAETADPEETRTQR